MASTASSTSATPLWERTDIHRSCLSLETLLSVLNDYCEAAGAVVILQKKLSKALRDTASQKASTEAATNALNASATIFEALSEIDHKFAKLADREYDAISNQVKKWFKKLAKEEKGHDDRIAAANGRIKQAGQLYEKKSKKSPREANDEHARYINLISALGPEISQEKYNHTLQVSQYHSNTVFNMAACAARVADSEWLRTCEGVRRFSPTIGPLGEWRALCEGAWSGTMPPDLPDVAESENPSQQVHFEAPESSSQPPPFPTPNTTLRSTPPSSFEPPRPLVDPNTGSVRSLSAFPAPPSHVPPPLMRPQQASSSQGSTNSHGSIPAFTRASTTVTESGRPPLPPLTVPPSPQPTRPSPSPMDSEPAITRSPAMPEAPVPPMLQPQPQPAKDVNAAPAPASAQDEQETKTPTLTKSIERSDTSTSNKSIVAAMRNRYSLDGGSPAGSPTKANSSVAVPRLPLSVTNLASRYQGVEGIKGPRPTSPRPLPLVDTFEAARVAEAAFRSRSPEARSVSASYANSAAREEKQRPELRAVATEDEAARRQRRLEELEIKEKEQALKERELQLEARAREMERQRNIQMSMNASMPSSPTRYAGAGSRDVDDVGRNGARYDSSPYRHSLAPPSQSNVPRSPSDESTIPMPLTESPSASTQHLNSLHPAYCSCETCRATSKSTKKGGWMRRLSMPIVGKGNGHGLGIGMDAKRNGSTTMLAVKEEPLTGTDRRSYDAGSGISNRNVGNLAIGRR
ncbi:hypothetical protein CYLTODRAFT_493329 [Cylindrobasidium torrendii FP15055 ss-10]|uniref:Uncharacterized protein n=1 Tax=Cylindrobasidium torrendii FP15055 ss-10 TaxID=1314674 RepID=A0A0D7B1W5_9AGAR|nr:hypothetical protein CYLTODRAFT_493329 [Cylindrobasidium torrendii FP15055 ss-10]